LRPRLPRRGGGPGELAGRTGGARPARHPGRRCRRPGAAAHRPDPGRPRAGRRRLPRQRPLRPRPRPPLPGRVVVIFRGLMIGAPRSGGGKTTVALALLAALRRRGVQVRAAKSGPDYIDPAFHAAATGTKGVNLDTW